MAQGIGNFIDRIQLGTDEENQIAIGSSAYAVCSTAATTQVKQINIKGFTLNVGTTIHVKFVNHNEAANPKLEIVNNLNNTSYEKPIVQYNNIPIGTDDETSGWQAGAVLTLTYDGTNWVRDQGYNTNTIYNALTPLEAWTGTATDNRIITAVNLKGILNKLGGSGLLLSHDSNGIILNHKNSIMAKNAYADTATTVNADGGTIKLTDIQYDTEGHITSSTDRTITLSVPAAGSHMHGHISADGTIGKTENWALDDEDELIVADKTNGWKLERSGIAFNTSITNKALTQAGTWEVFNNYIHPTTSGNKHIPSGGTNDDFLAWSSEGTAEWRKVNWNNLTGVPTVFTPDEHDHDYVTSIENLTGDITLSQLGLSKALRFIGSASSSISEETETAPTIYGRSNYIPEIGDVVLDSTEDEEYVCIDKTVVNDNTIYTWKLLGRSGDWSFSNHTHGNIATDGSLSEANRIVYTDSTGAIDVTNHYADTTHIGINESNIQTENLYVKGAIKFNLTNTNNASTNTFIIQDGNQQLYINSSGISTGTSSNTLYLQLNGGDITIGDQVDRISVSGLIDFTDGNALQYSGMPSISQNIDHNYNRPLWIMELGINGSIIKRPVYDTSLSYNTYERQLNIIHSSTAGSSGFHISYTENNIAVIDTSFIIGNDSSTYGIYDNYISNWILSTDTTDTNRIWHLNGTATKWTDAQIVYVTLGTASTNTTIQGGNPQAQTIGVNGVLNITNGGTNNTSVNACGIVYGNSEATAYSSTSAATNEGSVLIGHYNATNSTIAAPGWYDGLLLQGNANDDDYNAIFAKDVSIGGALSFDGTHTFGDAYTPIYWHDGVPQATTPIQYVPFIIEEGNLGVELRHNAFTANSYVLQIVVFAGESYLTSDIEWDSNTGIITLSCSPVNGEVQGYILVSRGNTLSSVVSTQKTPPDPNT